MGACLGSAAGKFFGPAYEVDEVDSVVSMFLQVSGAEQEVSCSSSSPQSHFELVKELISGAYLSDSDRIRLVLLYALRYEREGRAQVPLLLPVALMLPLCLAAFNAKDCDWSPALPSLLAFCKV